MFFIPIFFFLAGSVFEPTTKSIRNHVRLDGKIVFTYIALSVYVNIYMYFFHFTYLIR